MLDEAVGGRGAAAPPDGVGVGAGVGLAELTAVAADFAGSSGSGDGFLPQAQASSQAIGKRACGRNGETRSIWLERTRATRRAERHRGEPSNSIAASSFGLIASDDQRIVMRGNDSRAKHKLCSVRGERDVGMMRLSGFAVGVVSVGVLLTACSGAGSDGTETSQQSIVRATSLGGRNEVVMIYATVLNGETGAISRRTCTGAYFAPRVVATAAHCLDGDPASSEQVVQVLVYFGDDFAADQAELVPNGIAFDVPNPGQPSHFAEADSFELHPQWDRNLIYPDLGVVYLDRKLPFDPLPLARFRLDSSWQGKTATISGWGANVATGPATATGARVQRTGTTRIAGSPSLSDYHPEDPNPGILQASIRSNILKIDGRAPNANACFGDSGGPLLVSQWGQTYIAGVEYFGGLYCEEYSLYTRLDAFLPFFDSAYRKGGQAPLVPSLDCVAPNADGSFTAFFGYKNDNGVAVTVPLGPKNALALDTKKYRPTLFEPGQHRFAFGADFQANQTLVYTLSPDNSPTTTLRVDSRSKRCGVADQPAALCGQSCRAQLASGCTGLPGYGACIDGCLGFYEIFSEPTECKPLLDQWTSCVARQSPAPENWLCFEESSPGAADGFADAPGCQSFLDSFFSCIEG